MQWRAVAYWRSSSDAAPATAMFPLLAARRSSSAAAAEPRAASRSATARAAAAASAWTAKKRRRKKVSQGENISIIPLSAMQSIPPGSLRGDQPLL